MEAAPTKMILYCLFNNKVEISSVNVAILYFLFL